MRQADQPWYGSYRSNWVKLFDIFANMVQDSHVQGVIDTLSEGVKSKDFYITDGEGNKLDEVTELFKSKWYYDFLTGIINVRLYGFSLIQLQDFDRESMSLIAREVNRKHVRPDLGGIVKQQYDDKVFKTWTKEPFKKWTIYIYEQNLGKLNSCVRWWIYKTEISRYWAKYNKMFGIPPVVAKTNTKDTKRRQNAVDMLKKWLTSRWMVVDNDDVIEGFNMGSAANGQQFFENLIRLADEQISKSLLGSTMVLDNGSSRSQSEVHEDNTEKFIKSVCRLAKFITDKELMPRLRKIGFDVPEDARLVWDNSEKLTMKDRATVINILSNKFKVSTDVASEFVGIELEEKPEEPSQFGPGNPINGAIKDYYKEKFK
jgi:phage gp29-like protein